MKFYYCQKIQLSFSNLNSCKTIIGYGSPNKSGKASAHGSPLGEEEIELVRKKLKWKYEPFKIPKEILSEWRKIGEKGTKEEKRWNNIYAKKSVKIKKELDRTVNGKLPENFNKIIVKILYSLS